METKRISFRNKIYNDISTLKKVIERDQRKLTSLKLADDSHYIDRQIDILESKIASDKANIQYLEKKVTETYSGIYDDEISQYYIDNRTQTDSQDSKHKLVKQEQRKVDKDNATRTKLYTNEQYKDKRYEKDIASSYKYFKKICESAPDYLIHNLKSMPSNKGYLWRDVYFFGNLLEDNSMDQTMIFEKLNDGSMNIHEWSHNTIKIYNKKDRNKKLIYKRTR